MDVSIIIVNYNTAELIHNCLQSIYLQTKDISFEVIVSDNNSADGSVELIKTKFPEVILIENETNLGFGAANNRGVKIAKGKFIFFLNSDTILLNNAVKYFYDFWNEKSKNVNIGALGSWLLSNDSDVVHSWGEYPTFYSCKHYLNRLAISVFLRKFLFFKKKKCCSTQTDVNGFLEIGGYVTGADLFVLNNDDAYFDEDYFMYFEETDLQLNHFTKKGKKIFIIPGPKIIHLEGGSDKKANIRQNRQCFIGSLA